MKSKIYLLILILLLPVINIKALLINKDDINEPTYIIGNYMFTRNDSGDEYKGVLTTQLIMLASKTIASYEEEDMIIYYRTARGNWVDALDKNKEIVVPNSFEIINIDLNELGSLYKTETITKQVNDKEVSIVLKYYLMSNREIDIEIFVNDVELERVQYISDTSKPLLDLKDEVEYFVDIIYEDGVRTIYGADGKEYLVIDTNSVANTSSYPVIILDEDGEKLFDRQFMSPGTSVTIAGPCPNDQLIDEFYDTNYNGKSYYVTNDAIYYLKAIDDTNNDFNHHANQYKITLNNSEVVETKLSTCAVSFEGNVSIDNNETFTYYQTRTVTKQIGDESVLVKYGFYKIGSEDIGIDIAVGDNISYTAGYKPFLDDEYEVQDAHIDAIIPIFVNTEIGVVDDNNTYLKIVGSYYIDLVVFSNEGKYRFAGEIYNDDGELESLIDCPDYDKFVNQYKLDHNGDDSGIARYYIENGALYYLVNEGNYQVSEYEITFAESGTSIRRIGIYEASDGDTAILYPWYHIDTTGVVN